MTDSRPRSSTLPGMWVRLGEHFRLAARSSAETRSAWAVAVLLVGALLGAAFIFGRGLDNRFVSDDWVFLYDTARAQTPGDVLALVSFNTPRFVRSVQSLITLALYRASGLTPLPYHLTTLLLHLLNTGLIAAFVYRLARLSQVADPACLWLAALTAILFLLNWHAHEVLFWFSSLNEPLSVLFRVSALLAATVWWEPGGFRWRAYLLSLGLFALALLSKESAISFPAELLLVVALMARNRPGGMHLRSGLLALALFAVMALIWTWLYLLSARLAGSPVIQRAGLQVMQASLLEWIFRFIQYFDGNYIGGTVFLARSVPLMRLQLIGALILLPLAVWRRQSLWLFSLFWTLAVLTPYVATIPHDAAKPIVQVGLVGDRYLYYSAASAGLFLVVSLMWAAHEIARRWGGRRGLSALSGVVIVGLIGLNAARLFQDEAQWDTAGRIGAYIVDRSVTAMKGRPGVLCLANLPDNYRNKYVFRNGIGEALHLADPGAQLQIRLLSTASAQEAQQVGCAYVFTYDEQAALEAIP